MNIRFRGIALAAWVVGCGVAPGVQALAVWSRAETLDAQLAEVVRTEGRHAALAGASRALLAAIWSEIPSGSHVQEAPGTDVEGAVASKPSARDDAAQESLDIGDAATDPDWEKYLQELERIHEEQRTAKRRPRNEEAARAAEEAARAAELARLGTVELEGDVTVRLVRDGETFLGPGTLPPGGYDVYITWPNGVEKQIERVYVQRGKNIRIKCRKLFRRCIVQTAG